jgi:hypothetical protein
MNTCYLSNLFRPSLNEYLYGVLGLFWDWKIHPLQNVEAYS